MNQFNTSASIFSLANSCPPLTSLKSPEVLCSTEFFLAHLSSEKSPSLLIYLLTKEDLDGHSITPGGCSWDLLSLRCGGPGVLNMGKIHSRVEGSKKKKHSAQNPQGLHISYQVISGYHYLSGPVASSQE